MCDLCVQCLMGDGIACESLFGSKWVAARVHCVIQVIMGNHGRENTKEYVYYSYMHARAVGIS